MKELLRKLEGVHTLESAANVLKVKKKTAIDYVSKLRKQGYVKTKQTKDKKRVYYISFENRLGGYDYYDIINENSPVKIAKAQEYKVYGKSPSLEETLIFAIKTRSLRTILASLALFKKIKNWAHLYKLAKENNLRRELGVLYDLARKTMKARRMTKRFRNSSMPKKEDKFKFIIQGLKSDDFKEIEKEWKVYLPFNKQDLEDYRK